MGVTRGIGDVKEIDRNINTIVIYKVIKNLNLFYTSNRFTSCESMKLESRIVGMNLGGYGGMKGKASMINI